MDMAHLRDAEVLRLAFTPQAVSIPTRSYLNRVAYSQTRRDAKFRDQKAGEAKSDTGGATLSVLF